ncbi:DUF1905 domain-containing protein [Fluviispira vulneris]|uniref:DUF1905 domain-containing protein n=1 Tax=Fluviispira vulneris TaxID=2763012 RepID=UPI001648DA59|nr:DUF1905 domain-containing protein [Fluviispira vulneris]
MKKYKVTGKIKRFPGKGGWFYVELNKKISEAFRPLVKNRWPALLSASFTLNQTSWKSSIMPIKEGPLFIALPTKIRKCEQLEEGQKVTIEFLLSDNRIF